MSIASRILPPLQERCVRQGVAFSSSCALPGEKPVALDPAATGQILLNLVDNACKYGEGEVKLKIEGKDKSLRFIVSDEGPGVARAERERIFSPFYRGEHKDETNPGIGLGLALCRRWAREMRGYLNISHQDGSHFVLELPLL